LGDIIDCDADVDADGCTGGIEDADAEDMISYDDDDDDQRVDDVTN
jgi:hypothetical protein